MSNSDTSNNQSSLPLIANSPSSPRLSSLSPRLSPSSPSLPLISTPIQISSSPTIPITTSSSPSSLQTAFFEVIMYLI